MLPNTANILDQLLGGFDLNAPSSHGQTGAAAENGLFGTIMTGLLGAGINSKGEENCAQPQMLGIPLAGFGQLLGIIDPQAVAEPTVQIGEETSALPEAIEFAPADDPATLLIDGDGSEGSTPTRNGTTVVSDPTIDFTISNQQLRTLLASQQIAPTMPLQTGAYQIVDYRVNGDRVDLTVTSERSAQPIQLSLPIAALEAAFVQMAEHSNGAVRIPLLNQTTDQTGRLNQLLSALNLKTLEVRLTPTASDHGQVDQPVQVKLVAENSGQEIVIRTNIAAQQIKTPLMNQPTRAANDTRVSPDELENASDNSEKVKTQSQVATKSTGQTNPLLDKTDPRQLRTALATSRFDLPERLTQDKHTTPQPATAVELQFTKQDAAHPVAGDRAATTVRMSLPESAAQQLQPNGRSVMLKIEPEHLGPARLNLTLNNHGLTARVTVDNPAAKVAVEHSLEQLNAQLSKAGIQVDRIEVTLSGGGAQERFFERRPQWADGSSNGYPMADDEQDLENAVPAPAYTSPARQYVNAGGVNLWA